MDIFLLYAWTRLDAVVTMAIIVAITSGVVTLITGGIWGMSAVDGSSDANMAKTGCTRAAKIFMLAFAVIAVVPSSKDAMIIMGGGAVLEAARSDNAKRLASKSVQLIEQTLDGYLKPKEAK